MKRIVTLFTLCLAFLSANDALTVLIFPQDAAKGFSPLKEARLENEINFSYSTWFYDTDYSSIGMQLGKLNVGFKGLISSQIPIYGEQPADQPVGTTHYSNTCAYVGRRMDVNENIYVDATLKLLYEGLYYASAWGGGADLEINYSNNVNYTLFTGVSDLGKMSALNQESTELPTRIYAGGNIIFNFIQASVSAGTDLQFTPYVRLGISYIHPVFDVIYSYDSLLGINHIGADIKWKKLAVGYGLFLHRDGLGNMSMFTLGFKL